MFRTLAFSGHSTSASGHPAFSITRMHTASRGISSSLRSGVSIHPDLRRDSSVLTDISEWPIFADCPLEDVPFSISILIFIVFLKALDRQFVPRGKEQHDLGSIRCSKQTPWVVVTG